MWHWYQLASFSNSLQSLFGCISQKARNPYSPTCGWWVHSRADACSCFGLLGSKAQPPDPHPQFPTPCLAPDRNHSDSILCSGSLLNPHPEPVCLGRSDQGQIDPHNISPVITGHANPSTTLTWWFKEGTAYLEGSKLATIC